MNLFVTLVPVLLILGALFAIFFAFSAPVRTLPRWVSHAYLLLAAGMIGSAVLTYIRTHADPSLSERSHSLILQGRAWFEGFTVGILLILIMAGVFPRLFAGRRK